MDNTEWERRFKERVIAALLVPGSDWTVMEAKDAAQNEVENLAVEDRTDDPESDADESMSYWDADE